MKYKFNAKIINIPDKDIAKLEKIGLTKEEAIQTWLDDEGYTTNEEQEKSVADSKKLGRHYEQSAKPRKKSTKERKVDEEKKEILQKIAENLPENAEITAIQTETEIHFTLNGENYTVKLTKHRKK